jgi:hypothetical protein
MTTSSATIFVGCGGSGISTLRRFNSLIAEDTEWRKRADTDIFYMLFDTDVAELEGFSDGVKADMRGAKSPYVKEVQLSRDVAILQPHVQKCLPKDGSGEGRERIEEHWWTDSGGEPFTAERVRNTVRGAGQCPPVSYFLAWMKMREIEAAFEELVHEVIDRRSTSGRNPMENVNFVVVAGTAGGTGRGSWQALSFKLRELFNKQGITASPVAFLFDSSIYSSVCAAHPNQRRQMRVNSLTGFSETSCWIKNKDRADANEKYTYSLPDLREPGVSSQDVLQVDLSWDKANASPVDSAFLIFDRNAVARLGSIGDYYTMAGTALYTRTVESEIERRDINEYHAFRSVGSASWEVPATKLRKYFEGLMRIKSARALQETHLGAVQDAVDEVINGARLTLGGQTDYKADPNGGLMQRALSKISAERKSAIDHLKGALGDDENTAEDVIASLGDCLKVAPSGVAKAVAASISELDVSPVDLAKKAALDLFQNTGSVRALEAFGGILSARIRAEYEGLPSVADMTARGDDPESKGLVESRAGKEYLGIAGPRFSDGEAEDIVKHAIKWMRYAHYEGLQESFTTQYKSWAEEIGTWGENASSLLAQISLVEARFEKAALADTGHATLAAARENLFADPRDPARALLDKASSTRFFKRELKPVLGPGQETEALEAVVLSDESRDLILETVLGTNLQEMRSSQRDQLTNSLEEQLRGSSNLTGGFIERFSIARVIGDLRDVWKAHFEVLQGDGDRFDEVSDQFSEYFGFRPALEATGEITLPGPREFLIEMATSLAATCWPYWRLKSKTGISGGGVTIFMPCAPGEDEIPSEEVKQVDKALKGRVPSLVESKNPFVVLAYSSAGTDDLEQIQSLDYWKGDSTLLNLLESAESKEGSSIFDMETSNGGAGFVSPIYVRNEKLRGFRWKPWATARGADSESIEHATGVLCYALMEADSGTAQKLDDIGWQLPLIEESGRQNYRFTRREMHWAEDSITAPGGEVRPQVGGVWDAKGRVAVRVNQVELLLRGEAISTGPENARLADEWVSRIIEERREFWDDVAPHQGFAKGSALYAPFWQHQVERFDELRRNADEEDQPTWERLVAFAQGQLK